jgi:lipoprotein-anchoring transpeptidase ErfK/SrfK
MSRTQAWGWRGTSGASIAMLMSASFLLSGCAKMPASSASEVASPSQTPTPSATASATATPSASATPTDPLQSVDAKTKKEFGNCLTKYVSVGPGSSGKCAALVLKKISAANLGYKVATGNSISVAGANAILNYQRSRGLTANAYVGKETWLALATKAPTVTSELPTKCTTTTGVILCVDQAHRKLFWIRNGKVVKTFKVRTGGWNQHPKTHKWRNFPTADGTYKVFDKQVSPASDNYGSGAMPYSTMFHPDMYVHYSAGFHSDGYTKASHGCVNIGQLSEAQWIFKNTPIGATVYVYSTKKAATTSTTGTTTPTTATPTP